MFRLRGVVAGLLRTAECSALGNPLLLWMVVVLLLLLLLRSSQAARLPEVGVSRHW